MNANIVYNSIMSVPRVVGDYAISPAVSNLNDALFGRFLLAEQIEQEKILGIEAALMQHMLQPQFVARVIEKNFSRLTPEERKDLSLMLLQEFCGSMRWYFTGLPEAVSALGAELPAANGFPVEQPHTTLDAAVALIMKDIADAPEMIRPKVEAYVKEVLQAQKYEPEALHAQLGNSVSDGGFGFSPQRVRVIMQWILDIVGTYALEAVPEPARKKIDPNTIPKSFLEPHEIDDLLAVGERSNIIGTGPESEKRKLLVESILSAAPLDGQSKEIQTRWRSVVESRVAGVRDAAATKALLVAPQSGGGLGLPPYQADMLADRLEKAVGGLEQKKSEMVVMEKIASVQKETAHLTVGPEEKQRAQQKELNERFVTMFGKKAVEEMRGETRREIESPERAHPEEKKELLVPVAAAAAPAPAASTPAPQVPEKLKLLIDAENPILPVRPKPAAPPQPQAKKTTDIKHAPRIMGPIDELRTMSLIDFRRLSPDASVRIQKLRSKMQMIAQDGGAEQIAAVHAFEQSEPVRLYKELLREAIQKMQPVEDVAQARATAAQQTLEPEEVSAIKDFLQQIRYSGI